jgi:hypothetical protein
MAFPSAIRCGAVHYSKCSDVSVSFGVATSADEAEVRRLLRENPIGGRYGMSMESEPNGLAGTGLPEERKTIILARDDNTGAAIGLCQRVVRPTYVDGERRMLPYLGSLRIAASHRHRISLLKGGFRAMHQHGVRPDELACALTSIASDDAPGRRLLTAGLASLPKYERISDYVTFVFAPRRRRPADGIVRAVDADLIDIAEFLQRTLSQHQCTPVWSEAALRVIGAENFLVSRAKGEITGCVAVWDQSAFKQTVARGYPTAISIVRPLFNVLAPLVGKPRLPAIGTPLQLVYLSALAVKVDRADGLLPLLGAALDLAAMRGAGAAAFGLDARHLWVTAVRRAFGAIEYRTELYCVHEGGRRCAPGVDRLTMPDVGLL